ncbi:hypothetical protein [Psychroserpens mesophilus]|uniref:hypothetical protein n=1 Tax=Psychroserpens mesophilus TaxID=325473 RepID=UPI003F499109
MKNSVILSLLFVFGLYFSLNAQSSCSELIDYVKSNSYGSTYYSYDSDAISQVTFYEVTDDNYNTYYFALVRFTSSYTDYIYRVGSNTKSNYSFDYMDSAGKAFWEHIQPYNEVLDCAPELD